MQEGIAINLNQDELKQQAIAEYIAIIKQYPQFHQKTPDEIAKAIATQQRKVSAYQTKSSWGLCLSMGVGLLTAVSAAAVPLTIGSGGTMLPILMTLSGVGTMLCVASILIVDAYDVKVKQAEGYIKVAQQVIDKIKHVAAFSETLPNVDITPEVVPARKPSCFNRFSHFCSSLFTHNKKASPEAVKTCEPQASPVFR